jgi:hypothetical protein
MPKTASKFQTSMRKIVVLLRFKNVCKTENGNCVPREYFSAKGASSIQDLTWICIELFDTHLMGSN